METNQKTEHLRAKREIHCDQKIYKQQSKIRWSDKSTHTNDDEFESLTRLSKNTRNSLQHFGIIG